MTEGRSVLSELAYAFGRLSSRMTRRAHFEFHMLLPGLALRVASSPHVEDTRRRWPLVVDAPLSRSYSDKERSPYKPFQSYCLCAPSGRQSYPHGEGPGYNCYVHRAISPKVQLSTRNQMSHRHAKLPHSVIDGRRHAEPCRDAVMAITAMNS